jgi:hypothetical protein
MPALLFAIDASNVHINVRIEAKKCFQITKITKMTSRQEIKWILYLMDLGMTRQQAESAVHTMWVYHLNGL